MSTSCCFSYKENMSPQCKQQITNLFVATWFSKENCFYVNDPTANLIYYNRQHFFDELMALCSI